MEQTFGRLNGYIEIKPSRDVACRRVSIFVGEQIANLLYGKPPPLVLCGDSFLAAWAEYDEKAVVIKPKNVAQ